MCLAISWRHLLISHLQRLIRFRDSEIWDNTELNYHHHHTGNNKWIFSSSPQCCVLNASYLFFYVEFGGMWENTAQQPPYPALVSCMCAVLLVIDILLPLTTNVLSVQHCRWLQEASNKKPTSGTLRWEDFWVEGPPKAAATMI